VNKAKFRLWIEEHWMSWSIAALAVITIVALLVGTYAFLFETDSFQKQSLLASIPVYFFNSIIGAIAFVVLYRLVFMGGGLSKMNTTKAKAEMVSVKFSDVIGLSEAKKEAQEVVALIRDHARIQKIGGKIIRGILLQGPPGCGKTLIAKAIASESGIPFFPMSGSDFVEVFVGVGASRIRSLVKKARLMAKAHGACIVFIDELDVIGRGRTFSAFGGSEETNSTQNQLLVEMDGIRSGGDNVIYIGATNADESSLDKALLRPGRFDRKIFVGRPHLKEREDIYRYYLSKVQVDPAVDVHKLAQRTVYKTPADIEASVKEAALIATREGRNQVMFKDLSSALERIDLGISHRLPLSDKERETIATHEAGHLVTVYHQHPSHDVFKATILHRGGALGHVLPVPKEEQYTKTKPELLADIKVSLAGFLAERIRYGHTSTGASSDFANALGVAQAMVWQYGMGNKGVIGNYAITQNNNAVHSQISESFKNQLNEETQEILKQCERETEAYLRKEWALVEEFARLLIEREELNYDEIEDVFVQHGKSRATYKPQV
jgi:cell division protease FtsH